MFNKMNFENYEDYLLSINLAQISREFGFKKVGMNSLYLLTQVVKTYIEDLAITAKDYCELAGRSEVNLIDMLFSLIDRGVGKEDVIAYTHESKIKYRFAKQMYIGKIFNAEERERNSLIKKINLNNVVKSTAISDNVITAIPKSLHIFPRDFALKETEAKLDINEESKKARNAMKNLEKKSLEDIISSNNYYDLSKKHTRRKASLDISNIFSEIIKTDTINLGKKFKPSSKIDKDIQNLRKEEIFLSNLNMNENAMGKNMIDAHMESSELNDRSNFNMEDSNL